MKANYVQYKSPQFRVLSDSQIEDLHFASIHILERTGVSVYAPEALELLGEAGADISDPKRVKVPSLLVDRALADAPKNVTLYTTDGQPSTHLCGNRCYFGGVVDQPDILDPRTGKRRPHTVADAADLVRLIDALSNMAWVMNSSLAHGLPPAVAELVLQIQCVTNSSKPFASSTLNPENLKNILEICYIISGGKENFRARPFYVNSVEPTTPLVHNRESLEMSLICAEAGVPNIIFGMLMAGATCPATPAAAIAMANAELLSHLVVTQLKRPGAPIIYGAEANVMDMRTSIFPYGSPEACLWTAGLTELIHYYGLPVFGTAGTTDSKLLDAQAGVELTQQVIMAVLSGANLIHDVGLMDHCTMVSPELIVLMDEIVGMVRVMTGGIEINDETLALDLIDKVGPGGNFLAEDHTYRHFRSHWVPTVMDRVQMSLGDDGSSVKHCQDMLREKTLKILDEHHPQPLAEDMVAELKKLEKTWFDKAGLEHRYPTLD